jgi:DNA adenine methylase
MKENLIFFQYIGGKHFLVPLVLSLIPEHDVYVEPFCGSAKVLFAKKPSEIEILNDYDKKIANLFYVVIHKFDEFYEKIKWSIYSRELFNEFRNKIKNYKLPSLGDVDYAVWTYYLLETSFSGYLGRGFSTSRKRNHTKAFFDKISKLPQIHNRLRNVIIENLDFEEVIKRYDTEATFFYVDPPYYGAEQYYDVEFGKKDHQRLLSLLKHVKSKWLLSGYSNDLYNSELKQYYRIEKKIPKFSYGITNYSNRKEKPIAIEVLWANYDLYKTTQKQEFLIQFSIH